MVLQEKIKNVARRGARLAAERSPSGARADGARRSAAVPNGEGVASGSATSYLDISIFPFILFLLKTCFLYENFTI